MSCLVFPMSRKLIGTKSETGYFNLGLMLRRNFVTVHRRHILFLATTTLLPPLVVFIMEYSGLEPRSVNPQGLIRLQDFGSATVFQLPRVMKRSWLLVKVITVAASGKRTTCSLARSPLPMMSTEFHHASIL